MPHATAAASQPSTSVVRDLEPAALDTATAARYIGIGKTMLFEEIKAGRIPSRKIGRRTLILRNDLDAWLAAIPARNAA
ncbi:helix-turn-helix domain-containing protein [Xanthobacter sp. KR7-65]|uniref:helix-turn-helix domain-containing protein n=1 Tax=Xanthobacter sp. KR7-65 TaxID=3156612 RepID=UPI0032B5A6A9